MADASAELELSEGISSNVVERFRRFEKEVSHVTEFGLIGSITNWSKWSKSKKRIFKKSFKALIPSWYVHEFVREELTRQNKFEPALDSLVNTVSRRFTSAFDRMSHLRSIRRELISRKRMFR